jgi:hypothetical protein
MKTRERVRNEAMASCAGEGAGPAHDLIISLEAKLNE